MYFILLSLFSLFKSGCEIEGNFDEIGMFLSFGFLKLLKFVELKGCDWLICGIREEFFKFFFILNVFVVKEGKFIGVSGVRIGWSLFGDLMICRLMEFECSEKGGEVLDDEYFFMEFCSDFGFFFIIKELVLKLERNGNWFMVSDRLLKLLKLFKLFK